MGPSPEQNDNMILDFQGGARGLIQQGQGSSLWLYAQLLSQAAPAGLELAQRGGPVAGDGVEVNEVLVRALLGRLDSQDPARRRDGETYGA